VVNLNLSMLSLNITGMPAQQQGVSNTNITVQEQAAGFKEFVTGLISNTNTEAYENQKNTLVSLLNSNNNLKSAVYTAAAALNITGDITKLAAQPEAVIAANPVVIAAAEKFALTPAEKESFIAAVKTAVVEMAAKQISSSVPESVEAAKVSAAAASEAAVKQGEAFAPAAVAAGKAEPAPENPPAVNAKKPQGPVLAAKETVKIEIPLTPKLKESSEGLKQAVNELRASLGEFITEKFETLKDKVSAPSNMTPDINSIVLFQSGMVEIAKISSMTAGPVAAAAESGNKTVQIPMTPGRLADYSSKQMTQAVNVIVMAADAAAVPVVQAAMPAAQQKPETKTGNGEAKPEIKVNAQQVIGTENKQAAPVFVPSTDSAQAKSPVNNNVLYTSQDAKVRTVTVAVPFNGNTEQLAAVKEATAQVKEVVGKIINLVNEMNGELMVIKQASLAAKNSGAQANQPAVMPAAKPVVQPAAENLINVKSAPAVDTQPAVKLPQEAVQAPVSNRPEIAASEAKIKPEYKLMPGMTKQEVEVKIKEDAKWVVDSVAAKIKYEIETAKPVSAPVFENAAEVSAKAKESLIIRQITENIVVPKASQKTEVNISLKPENLGNVAVKLESEGRTIKVMIQVANSEVKETLKAGLAELRTSLENKGIEVANMNITVMNNNESAFGNGNYRQPQAYVKPETNVLKNSAEAENNKPVSGNDGTGALNILA